MGLLLGRMAEGEALCFFILMAAWMLLRTRVGEDLGSVRVRCYGLLPLGIINPIAVTASRLRRWFRRLFLILVRSFSASKSSFFILFRFGAEIVLRLQFRLPWGVILSYFATHSLQIRCNGCINVPWCCSCVRNTLVFCSWACIGGAASTMMKVGRWFVSRLFSSLPLFMFLLKFL